MHIVTLIYLERDAVSFGNVLLTASQVVVAGIALPSIAAGFAAAMELSVGPRRYRGTWVVPSAGFGVFTAIERSQMEESAKDCPRQWKVGNDEGGRRFTNVPKGPRRPKRLVETVKFVEDRGQNLWQELR